jgi:hypothetical protein
MNSFMPIQLLLLAQKYLLNLLGSCLIDGGSVLAILTRTIALIIQSSESII